ncbi:MAG: PEP-CTERM sorting domain-containing protein [Burkholderiaceae bacterium]|nr:PEP-CTERM sorting domain-containing protein [Burkholderiaceae bacterium]
MREITFDDGLVPCIPPECGGEIPLPGTAGLLGLGAAALGFALRRRRQS